jgi:hypothetical protein
MEINEQNNLILNSSQLNKGNYLIRIIYLINKYINNFILLFYSLIILYFIRCIE